MYIYIYIYAYIHIYVYIHIGGVLRLFVNGVRDGEVILEESLQGIQGDRYIYIYMETTGIECIYRYIDIYIQG